MSRLSDIPVEVVSHSDTQHSVSPALRALLQELQTMLQRLVDTGENHCIDIRSLPMLPGDYDRLQHILGEGEIMATIDSLGPSHVRETAIPGIWWISHKNADDDILTEFIEITRLPAILQTQAEDLHEAPARLRLILQDLDDNSPIESSNGGTNDAEQ